MVFLYDLPAIVRIMIVFAVILMAIRKKSSLGVAFLLGTALLGLLFGLDPLAMAKSALLSIIDLKTLSLSILVCLILVLSHSMEKAGQMARLLGSFKGLIKHPGLNLIVFPALIGLLPMPGGAIFSAPMVNSLGKARGLTPAQLSFVNYWFRHIWEYWWPLYPGVLLATAMAGLDLAIFVLMLQPISLVAFFAGYFPLRLIMNRDRYQTTPSNDYRPPITPFLRELMPILLVIVCGLTAGWLLSIWLSGITASIAKELGLILALVVAIAWVWRTNQISTAERWSILGQPEMLRMFLMVCAILMFKSMLIDSKAVEALASEFVRWHIPLVPITILLPLLVGNVAGLTIAFVGTTFPILISLLQTFGQTHLMMPYMMLAVVSGFVGVLFSPLHLCLLLSNEYFHARLRIVYGHLLIPCASLLIAGALYFWALTGLGI